MRTMFEAAFTVRGEPANDRFVAHLAPWIAPRRRRGESGGESGSVTMLMAGLILIAGLVVVGLARLGGAAVDRASAQAAADASALAGARHGEGEAVRVAERNAATLVSFTSETQTDGSTEVQVVVTLGEVRVSARARYVPPPPPPEPPTVPDTSIPVSIAIVTSPP